MVSLQILYNILAVSFLALLVLLLAITCYLIYQHSKYSHIPGPPRDNFFFGHVPTIRRERLKGKEFPDILEQFSHKYGAIFVIWAFHNPVVIAISPELTKKVLVTLNLPKSPRVYNHLKLVFSQRCLGNGILTELDNDTWQRKRSMLNPAFHRKYLMNLMEAFNVTCDRLIDKLSLLADGKTQVDMADEMSRATLDIIGKVAFDINLNAIEDAHTPFPTNNLTALKGIQESFRNPLWKLNIFHWPYQWKVIKAIKFLRQFGEKVILQRGAAINEGKAVPSDILNHILHMMNKDPQITLDDLVDNFVTFFIAGQETTSNQLAFTIFEIGTHPEIEQRISDEITQVLGSRNFVSYEDLGKFQYLGQTLKESLRLHTPISGMTRYTHDEIDLGGYTIPANTEVGLSIHTTQRYAEVWPDPENFNPDRFDSSSEGTITGPMYFPFAIGPRTCIGKAIAQFEAKVVMSRLYQEFKIRLVPGQKLIHEATLTTRPKGGVLCTLEKR